MAKPPNSRDKSIRPALLVTGASGLLGHALCRLARQQWSVHAVYRRHHPQVEGIHPVQWDLSDLGSLAWLIDSIRPYGVVHAAAASQVGDCQAHPRQTAVINVQVPARLAALCTERKIPLALISTDLVFDGRAAPYDEQRVPEPSCVYGEQKFRAECEVLRRHPQALVCRLPLLFGLSPYAQHNFTVHMLRAIIRKEPLHLFMDEFRTPVDTWSAARGVLALVGRCQGLLHLGGRTRVSRYELGRLYAAALGVEPDRIVPTRLTAAQLPYPRSPDCTLDSRRAFDLGYHPTPLTEAVLQMAALFMRGQWMAEQFTRFS